MPAILQRLMRHSNIKTTMTYYASPGEDQTADAVWDAYDARITNTFANTSKKQAENPAKLHRPFDGIVKPTTANSQRRPGLLRIVAPAAGRRSTE